MATKIMRLLVYIVVWAQAYFHTKWHIDPPSPLAIIDMGRKKLEWADVLFGGGWSTSSKTLPGPKPTFVPSGILIHQAGYIMLDGDPAPPSKKWGTPPPSILGPCLLWPNVWMCPDCSWFGGRPQQGPHCVSYLAPPQKKRKGAHATIFGPCMSVVARRLGASRCLLVRR